MRTGRGGKAWVYCRRCHEATLLRPSVPQAFDDGGWECVVHFLDAHARHPLTQLVPTRAERCVYSGPIWDLNTIAWIEVTDGHELFTVEVWRPDAGEARRYRVRPGGLPAQCRGIDMDETLAARAWTQAFGAGRHEGALRRILARAREILAGDGYHEIVPEFDDVDDPQVQFASWPARARAALEEAGCRELPDTLHPLWREFLREQTQAHGAWGLRVRTMTPRPTAGAALAAPL